MVHYDTIRLGDRFHRSSGPYVVTECRQYKGWCEVWIEPEPTDYARPEAKGHSACIHPGNETLWNRIER